MNISILTNTLLFQDCSSEEIESMLKCLNAKEKKYKKGETIYHAGSKIHALGIVLSGSVSIEKDDFWGNKTILDNIGPGQVFAETYACLPDEPLLVCAVADTNTTILFLDMRHLLQTCPQSCEHHNKIIHNLLSIFAQKNLNLSRRSFHTAPKSIRGRLLSYLSFQASLKGSLSFTIPFNRQQLADYLGVERSALSNELSKMQKEGLLTTKKSSFTLSEWH